MGYNFQGNYNPPIRRQSAKNSAIFASSQKNEKTKITIEGRSNSVIVQNSKPQNLPGPN